MTRFEHCLHTTRDGLARYCCWCSLGQERIYEPEALHGPRFQGDRYTWHWTPSSMNDCPRDAVEEPETRANGG